MAKFSDLVNQEKPVLIDFFATWCGPCKMMSPVLENIKSKMGNDISIIKIDVDKNQLLARKYHIQGVPTFMIFKKGEQKWKKSGALSENIITNELKKYL